MYFNQSSSVQGVYFSECVGIKCSCRWADEMPKPKMYTSRNEHGQLVVKWGFLQADKPTNGTFWTKHINLTTVIIQ